MTLTPHPDVHAHWTAVLEALEGVGIGVIIIADRGGKLERWYTSRRAATLMGIDPAAEVPVLGTIIEEDRPRFEALRARQGAGLEVPRSFETVVKRPDGSRAPVEVQVSRVAIDGGYLAITLVRDLSERSTAHGQQLEAERMAIVGAIAAGVAHEINNPLTYVLLHLRSLRKAMPRWNLPPEVAADVTRLIDEAEGGASRVKVIVRDLLALARGHADAGIGGDGIDVDKVVDGAIRLLSPSMQHRVRIAREGAPAPSVAGDETRLAHAVLAMLLFAAGGFDHDDPAVNQVVVRVIPDGGEVRIEVADNGSDIAPDQLARAFEPFYQPRGGSPGASLAVVRAVATALGGTAALDRRPGGGALITMRLPATSGF